MSGWLRPSRSRTGLGRWLTFRRRLTLVWIQILMLFIKVRSLVRKFKASTREDPPWISDIVLESR